LWFEHNVPKLPSGETKKAAQRKFSTAGLLQNPVMCFFSLQDLSVESCRKSAAAFLKANAQRTLGTAAG